MVKVYTYRIRAGNAISIVCDDTINNISQGNLVFTFGTESQEINSCSADQDLLKSSDMCMLGGNYFSATYRAYPGKVNGKLVFNSVITKKPVLSNEYGQSCNPETINFDVHDVLKSEF